MLHRVLLAGLLGWALMGNASPALAQKVKSAPFSYLPEQGTDRYDMRVPQKTLPLTDGTGFVILAHQSAGGYAVERYDADLKKQWSTTIPVNPGETLEAFGRGPQQALVVLHHKDESSQNLSVVAVNLQSGQKGAAKVVMTAPARDRRPGVSISPDGTRLVAFRYLAREQQVKSIAATLFDQNLAQLQEKAYDFRDLGDFFSPSVHVANDGTQYVTLISDHMKKLTVRRYPAGSSTEIKVLGVPVGGTFGGKSVTIRDAQFKVLNDGSLYAAALCADYQTGEYYSLKVVKYDFSGAGDMKFSPEFRFTPAYLAEVSKSSGIDVKRLDDVYLGELLLTPEKQLVVVAEKHFEEGGSEAPVHARELHVFGYNEYGQPTWHSIVAKDQVAPAVDAYTGIGFRAAVFGSTVQVLTLETINKKSDLYLRRINTQTGVVSPPERLKLNVADDKSLAYVKDFTTWLGEKTIIAVSRPSKKSAALQLEKIVVK
ncbi:hypothetical protein Q3A66_17920 [Hymenobacter sp. BT770]|uniref:hypothetical protein n=1 Tax=Hymenobacter sp. BT770 TaxID=2886942 RepID=UPI001D102251|nr:hypothetical protein [Hymenobacter sp. BT770]MCC3155032.1 hypothetical protein [Hymenobacter sp. BT770]MDO3416950.1 hypothetical protein [Hymenobacter sp. BT770]